MCRKSSPSRWGAQAGQVFEGDRRFDLVVRLPDSMRTRAEDLQRLPIPLPRVESQPAEEASIARTAAAPPFVPLGHVAAIDVAEGTNQISRENGKRSIVVQCNVRGRDLGSFVSEAQSRVAALRVPPGQWLAWGGQFENLVAAKQRLTLVVPACFFLIFLLLFSTFKSTGTPCWSSAPFRSVSLAALSPSRSAGCLSPSPLPSASSPFPVWPSSTAW
ncbi:MAG: efflux RND transporter permease subunit [Phycisphaerales bacterium]